MSLNPAMWIMTLAEVAFWIALTAIFWRKNLQKRFPAMGWYLALRATSTPSLLALLAIQSLSSDRLWFAAYFFGYWAVYLAGTALLFFITLEVFHSALAGFSGLMRFGTVIFRWAAVASVIISLSTISISHLNIFSGSPSAYYRLIPTLAYQLARSMSIIELCLLAFLCLSMNALRLSARDLGFGIALGFGVFAAGDFIQASLLAWNSALTDPIQFVGEGITLFALCLWITYAALPEPERKPVVVPASSTIYRWNEIASALGHKSPKIAVPQPASAFFLTDVEKVVEKVITRTLTESESNS